MSLISRKSSTSKDLYYIGTMSGTSADGLDIVIAKIPDKNNIHLVHSYFCKYPQKLSQRIKQLQTLDSQTLFTTHQSTLDQLDQKLAIFFAEHIQRCLCEANISAGQIIAIGNHGQTILHQPNAKNAFSLQLCNAQTLSEACSIPVIADLRKADIDQGGQGAPLMPAFHAAIFHHSIPCAVVNIGGISNTSFLDQNTVRGFDNGPGNTLMDVWVSRHLQLDYDSCGKWAKSGSVNNILLQQFLNDPYFSLPIPKSTGQDAFNLQWLNTHLTEFESILAEDVQATLCDLTAKSIIDDIRTYGDDIDNVFICGGGAKNTFLMERLQHFADKRIQVMTTSKLGMDTDWVESLGFAWLAYCHEHGITGNLPSVTGAKKEVILGNRFDPVSNLTQS